MPSMTTPISSPAEPASPEGRKPSTLLGQAIVLVACGLGFGYVRYSPGTVGALWGVPLAWGLGQLHLGWQVAAIVALLMIGVPICGRAAEALGRKDPGAVVFDEIASMPIVFLLVDLQTGPSSRIATILVVGFLLHRVFDITKPPPARQFERLQPAGLGIMIDDTVAAIYACLALHGLLAIGMLEFFNQ